MCLGYVYFPQMYYETEEEARRSVVKGEAWAFITVASNFSDALRSRLENGRDVPEEDILASTIDVFQDKSSKL